MQKAVWIVENSTHSLNRINESANGVKDYKMSGIFTEFNVLNRNQRIYTPDKFLPSLNEMQGRIEQFGGVYGEYDHPDIFDISLQRASHLIESVTYDQNRNVVTGQMKLLNNYWGKEARALVDDNCPLFVSSRAAGVTESNGHVALKKLFTYDLVADPGFASAKMNLNNINESIGFSEDSNYRIFEMKDESKINELVNMNNSNDIISRAQMKEYFDYLSTEINKTNQTITKYINEGRDANEIHNLLEYKENMHKQQTNIMGYLKYVSEKMTVLINENKELKEKVNKVIAFTEHVAEHAYQNTKYSEYILEQLDKSVTFTEYVAEHTKNGIEFIEYVAENAANTISHNNHLAEHIEDNIAYMKFIANRVDGAFDYAGRIAESLNSLNGGRINEAVISVETPVEFLGLQNDGENKEGEEENAQAQPAQEAQPEAQAAIQAQADAAAQAQPAAQEAQPSEEVTTNTVEDVPAEGAAQPVQDGGDMSDISSEENTMPTDVAGDVTTTPTSGGQAAVVKISPDATGFVVNVGADGVTVQPSGSDDTVTVPNEEIMPLDIEDDKESLSEKMNLLIAEAKKREASKDNDPHFYKFMNESQINDFKVLSDNERERVISVLNESEYFCNHDVMTIIRKTLSVPAQSLTERLLTKLPTELSSAWESLTEAQKGSIIAQAKFYPLDTDDQVVNFWETRKIERILPIQEGKVEVQTPSFDDNSLSDSDLNSFLDKFEALR